MLEIIGSGQMQDLERNAFASHPQRQLAKEFVETVGLEIGRQLEERIGCFRHRYGFTPSVYLMCGRGNNSADAYVCGRYLLGCSVEVFAYQPVDQGQESELCLASKQQFIDHGGSTQTIMVGQSTWRMKNLALFSTGCLERDFARLFLVFMLN